MFIEHRIWFEWAQIKSSIFDKLWQQTKTECNPFFFAAHMSIVSRKCFNYYNSFHILFSWLIIELYFLRVWFKIRVGKISSKFWEENMTKELKGNFRGNFKHGKLKTCFVLPNLPLSIIKHSNKYHPNNEIWVCAPTFSQLDFVQMCFSFGLADWLQLAPSIEILSLTKMKLYMKLSCVISFD